MKHAFLRLISPLIKLWQTCKKYVCRRVTFKDVTGDGKLDTIISNDIHDDWKSKLPNTSSSVNTHDDLKEEEEDDC